MTQTDRQRDRHRTITLAVTQTDKHNDNKKKEKKNTNKNNNKTVLQSTEDYWWQHSCSRDLNLWPDLDTDLTSRFCRCTRISRMNFIRSTLSQVTALETERLSDNNSRQNSHCMWHLSSGHGVESSKCVSWVSSCDEYRTSYKWCTMVSATF